MRFPILCPECLPLGIIERGNRACPVCYTWDPVTGYRNSGLTTESIEFPDRTEPETFRAKLEEVTKDRKIAFDSGIPVRFRSAATSWKWIKAPGTISGRTRLYALECGHEATNHFLLKTLSCKTCHATYLKAAGYG